MRRNKRMSSIGFFVLVFGITLGGIGGLWAGLAILHETNPKSAAKIEADLEKHLGPIRDYLVEKTK